MIHRHGYSADTPPGHKSSPIYKLFYRRRNFLKNHAAMQSLHGVYTRVTQVDESAVHERLQQLFAGAPSSSETFQPFHATHGSLC